MLDQEDLKWIAATSTELNSALQQASRYIDLARRHRGEHNYVDLLAERVELASKSAQSLFDRVTSKILTGAARKSAAARKSEAGFAVMAPPDTSKAEPRRESDRGTRRNEGTRAANGPDSEPAVSEAVDFQGVHPGMNIKNPGGKLDCILLIEDEPDVAEVASEMLAEEGYKVILAHDGFEALKIYERLGDQIGLVILDYFLPVIDGDAVFDELRSINPSVNVVLSSGFAEQTKIASMLAQGLRGFVPKPYSREKLLEQVRSSLDAARENTR